MPSTRRQKAKARKSREMDMLSDIENMDVMLGNGSSNPIERELTDAFEQSSVQGDVESNEHLGNQYTSFAYENNLPRQDDIRQSLETFSNEFNLRLSQEMDSMMSMMHSQINRATVMLSQKGLFLKSRSLWVLCPLQETGTLRPVYRQIARKTGNVHPGLNQNLQRRTHSLHVI